MNPDHARRSKKSLARVRYALPLLGLLVASGCAEQGEPLYPVSGEVTFEGEPLAEGTIAFVPIDGRSPHATPITAGKYEVELPAGPQKVVIEASRFIGPEDKVMGLRPREQFVPDKYNIESTLQVEVKSDQANEFNFPLK
jgi:hypothetical protein